MGLLGFADRKTPLRLLILTVLFALPGLAVLRPIAPEAWWPTPDFWWHLRTADWIVEHGAVPTTDPFSAFGAGRPWIAYSWVFALIIRTLYGALGLIGVMGYTLVLSLAIGVALYLLVRRLLPHFAASVAITAAGVAALVPVLSPRPWLLTILFFFIELQVLLTASRSGNWRILWLLPFLFAVWANTHIQFVYGLGALVLAGLAAVLGPVAGRFGMEVDPGPIPVRRLLVLLGACVLATLVGPYHVRLYLVIVELVTQSGVFQSINELVAMQFRDPADWIVLSLTLASVFALGRQRRIPLFPALLLLAGVALAFRARRDAWFLVGASAATLAQSLAPVLRTDPLAITKVRGSVLALGVTGSILAVALARDISEQRLRAIAARRYPVQAAAVVEQRRLPGPLYNHFNWGGYLMWRLPHLPVSMDGRTNVHLPERVDRSLNTWSGGAGWDTDPELSAARLVIASARVPLTPLLRSDPRFRVVYEDAVAVVFVANPDSASGPPAEALPPAGLPPSP